MTGEPGETAAAVMRLREAVERAVGLPKSDIESITVLIDAGEWRVALEAGQRRGARLAYISDVTLVLDAFRDGRLTAEDCERWAEALHGRDDVKLQDQGSELLKQTSQSLLCRGLCLAVSLDHFDAI